MGACSELRLCAEVGQVRTFCVKSKGNFLTVLQTIVQVMYTQYGKRLDIIDTDNAPEFGRGEKGDTDVINYLLSTGIKPSSSEPYGHEQAGSQERLHRTLDEGMRAAHRAEQWSVVWSNACC